MSHVVFRRARRASQNTRHTRFRQKCSEYKMVLASYSRPSRLPGLFSWLPIPLFFPQAERIHKIFSK